MARAWVWLRDHAEVVAFTAGLLAFAFVGGMAVGRLGLFPYPILNAAWDAASDWRANWRAYAGIRPKYLQPTDRTEGGVTIHDPARAFAGYTLVATYMGDHYDAYLLDMDGQVVHRWDASARRLFPESAIAQSAGGTAVLDIHGVHLYENGDLVVSLGGQGAAKLDRCGRVVWRIAQETHHHVEPLPDGGVIIPDRVKRAEVAPDRPKIGLGPSGFYYDDRILHVDASGRVVSEKSVIDILWQSGWASVLLSGPDLAKTVETEDPVHLNDVELLTPELAAAFPLFEPGDLMLSLKHSNTILVVDPDDWQVRWSMTGPMLMQHDPDFLPNGNILVYDNRVTGPKPLLGNTRLIEVSPTSRTVVRVHEGTGDQAFYASERGEQQVLPNGNILLVAPFGGRLVEIAADSNYEVVWEWVNLIEPGFVGLITDVQRIAKPNVDWIGAACDGPDVATGGRTGALLSQLALTAIVSAPAL